MISCLEKRLLFQLFFNILSLFLGTVSQLRMSQHLYFHKRLISTVHMLLKNVSCDFIKKKNTFRAVKRSRCSTKPSRPGLQSFIFEMLGLGSVIDVGLV